MVLEEEYQFICGQENCNEEKQKRRKHGKKKKKFVEDTAKVVEELPLMVSAREEENLISDDGTDRNKKTVNKRHSLKANIENPDEQEANPESMSKGIGLVGDEGLAKSKRDKKNQSLEEADNGKEEQEVTKSIDLEGHLQSSDGKVDIRKNKTKRQLLKEAAKANKCGVCYLSRIPPHMNPLQLRQILSRYGDIQRIYLTPEKESKVILFVIGLCSVYFFFSILFSNFLLSLSLRHVCSLTPLF